MTAVDVAAHGEVAELAEGRGELTGLALWLLAERHKARSQATEPHELLKLCQTDAAGWLVATENLQPDSSVDHFNDGKYTLLHSPGHSPRRQEASQCVSCRKVRMHDGRGTLDLYPWGFAKTGGGVALGAAGAVPARGNAEPGAVAGRPPGSAAAEVADAAGVPPPPSRAAGRVGQHCCPHCGVRRPQPVQPRCGGTSHSV